MSTWALVVVMKYAIHVASFNNIVIGGFGSQQKCEEAAKQISTDSDYERHICLEVKQ
jgi:hypothetical protein